MKAVKRNHNGYKATLIINDNVYLAQQIAASWYLGYRYRCPEMLRKIHRTYKIGATANTLEILQLMYT
jgi:thiamine monophosphate synthase